MRRLVLFASLCLALFIGPRSAAALEFSADQVVQNSGKTMKGKIYMASDRWRREMSVEGMGHVMIGRMDKKVMWMIMSHQKAYMEMPFRPDQAPKTEEKFHNEVSRKKIGTETIDGHPCDKYEVTTASDGRQEKMIQWMATDIHFSIKIASADGKMVIEYKNIKMGKQDASLFEVPSGYQRMGMPGPAGMPEGMTHPMPRGLPEMPGK